jgi:hypothetical protein
MERFQYCSPFTWHPSDPIHENPSQTDLSLSPSCPNQACLPPASPAKVDLTYDWLFLCLEPLLAIPEGEASPLSLAECTTCLLVV